MNHSHKVQSLSKNASAPRGARTLSSDHRAAQETDPGPETLGERGGLAGAPWGEGGFASLAAFVLQVGIGCVLLQYFLHVLNT